MTESSILETLSPEIKTRVEEWLYGPFDEQTKEEIRKKMVESPQELQDAFYKTLTFGTGGIRGTMGFGTNRLNKYTIASTTQGLANYLLEQFKEMPISVFVSHDSRNHSREFAEETAAVLAGNGIKVFITRDLRPTPLVSFGCRFKKCNAAVMITASHNPPEYNGYKVYWNDGAQVLPPHDIGIQAEIAKISNINQVKRVDSINNPLIELVEDEVDDAYLKAISTLAFYRQENLQSGNELKIIYTSLHGTGITLAPRALKLWGFNQLFYVDQQIIPSGDFPTVHFPNPEEKEALELGIKTLKERNADILIANDPDADRVGVAVMHEGLPRILTGNQVACICLEHICNALENGQKIDARTAFIKTIMTTELFKAICDRYEVNCTDTLPGFKYIAEKIRLWEVEENGKQFIFGGEESYGYLLGTFSRDKDAIVSSALIAEVALHAKLQNKTLIDLLEDLHQTYGIYYEKILSVNYSDTLEGHQKMKSAMEIFRSNPFNEIEGHTVLAIDDYLSLERKDLSANQMIKLQFAPANILVYWLDDGSKLMIRPSGTEPKIKIYCSIIQKEYEDIEQGEKLAEERAKELLEAVNERLTS